MQIDLSIIIVTYNSEDTIVDCIQSIYDLTDGITYEIIVVDNASSDNTEKIVREKFRSLYIIQTGANLGFAAACNIGMKKSVGIHIILLNPDTQLMNNALFIMSKFLQDHTEAGAVGGLLMQDEVTPQRSYNLAFPSAAQALFDTTGLSKLFPGKIPSLGIIPSMNDLKRMQVSYIPGADLMFRRTELKKIGYFDERFFMFAEDSDWCFRLIKETGLRVFFLPDAKIKHILGASAGQRSTTRARMNLKSYYRFIKKNYGLINLLITRFIYIVVYKLKILLAILRYCFQFKRRSYWKAEIQYYGALLKVSCLPDRAITYI
ncbi:MAG: glycosyltransferase family 2 protein [bacterium]